MQRCREIRGATAPLKPSRQLPPCSVAHHLAAVSLGQTLTLVVEGATQDLTLAVRDDHGMFLAEVSLTAPGGEVPIPAAAGAQTGGLSIMATPGEPGLSTRYRAGIRCDAGCDHEATRYPIVLVHGAGGSAFFGGFE